MCSGAPRAWNGVAVTERDDDLNAIRRLAFDWRTGWLSGDVDALLSLYGDDPIVLPEGQAALRGKDAIRSLYQAVLQDFAIKSESTLIECDASGDLGYFWTAYALTATPKRGGEPARSVGKSIFIVRREPGGAGVTSSC
jgi:uncharacterized protein (TIGR02246 family)